MDTGRISVRYAKALLEVAQKNGSANKVYEEMESVSNAFFAVPDLKKAMNNPHVTTDERKKLLLSAAGNESSPVSSEFSKFVDLVTDRKRENYFHSISLVFQDLYRKDNDIIIGIAADSDFCNQFNLFIIPHFHGFFKVLNKKTVTFRTVSPLLPKLLHPAKEG